MAFQSLLMFSTLFALSYIIYLAITRLYSSPVAHIPGPRLAAFSFWYEFYYDVFLGGRYTWKIAELHEKYGPIIRINPYEVHINDPDFYDEVYVSGSRRKTDQWSWTVPMFGTPNSILATIEHDVHRRRRNAYSNYFSKQAIRKYSDVIQAAVDKLCTKLEESRTTGKKINLMHAYTAMTGDVVTGYCFPQSYGLLDQPDFAPDYHDLWISILSGSHVLKQFPWIFPLMLSFPNWFVDRFLPDLAVTYRWHRVWRKQIQDVQSEDLRATSNDRSEQRPSIFSTLLSSDLPPSDKSIPRLVEDAQTMVGAGSITTSFALTLGTYYILSSPPILHTLLTELEALPSNPMPPLPTLEKLPYLTAVYLETLRISYGVSHRLQRVCPDQALHYGTTVIPPGTPVSMSAPLIHDHPAIFPRPRSFDPERWLHAGGPALQKYLVAFSRGSRQCLGMHLGAAELLMGIAGVVRRFGRGMRVVDTEWGRDVEVRRDFFTPMAGEGGRGIWVVVGN
ncbi:MAG: hypothetical protein Q9195_003510 [Heterodermia aff. obscurata]